MKAWALIGGCLSTLMFIWPAYALDEPALKRGLSYQEARTWHEQFLSSEPTKAERLHAMRSLIKASKLGDRGLERIFHNFEGRYAIDPRTPGVEKSVLMQLSESTSQAKGYRRELLYASAFHNDPRFGLEAMNRPLGNTDADIVVHHRQSGLYGRIEVKDYSLSSQTTNLKKLKVQIDKMAVEARRTGRPQFWINRRAVSPEIQRYANSKGVFVLGNVSTGIGTRKTISSAKAMDIVAEEFANTGKMRAILGGGQLAFGALMISSAVPDVWEAVQTLSKSELLTMDAWLRVGQHGSSLLAGTSMVTSGSALLASRFASEGGQSSLYRLGRWGGVAGAVLFGVREVFLVTRYLRGDVNSREFRTELWVQATSGAGMWIGGYLGTSILKNPTWGAPLGTNAGWWVGHEFGNRTAAVYYERKFGKLDEAFGNAVYARYGIN